MNITKEQADKVIKAALAAKEIIDGLPIFHNAGYAAQLNDEALSIMRGLAEDAEPVPKTWHKVGYYHKAETADECDFYFLDTINGDCPDCHPCYADTEALERPSPQAAQTEGWTGDTEIDAALIMLDRMDVGHDDDARVDEISKLLRKLARRAGRKG